MRKIIFRGKKVDGGEWVEGYYAPTCYGKFPCEPSIIPEPEGSWIPEKVLIETIGQFIGLRDKNLKRVFETDILLDTESGRKYQVKYFEEFARYGLANKAGSIEIDDIEEFINDMVVVGNMIDTPERLK